MAKLFQALAPETRILLIGDKDQLASVEAGSVLGDICDRQVIHGFSKNFLNEIQSFTQIKFGDEVLSAQNASGLQDCITVLQKSYRFDPQSGIGGLSKSVNRGDSDTALAYLNDPADKSIAWRDLRPAANSVRDLRDLIAEGYRKYLTLHDPVLAMNGPILSAHKILNRLNSSIANTGSCIVKYFL